MSKWISVKDKLPEITRETCSDDVLLAAYLGCVDVQFIEQGIFIHQKNGKKKWRGNSGFQFKETDITHWMNLPELPKIK